MKTKIIVLMILVWVVCLPLQVLADQETHGFAAGSFIIPMDNFYQNPADGGALEAYGLVYYLLNYKNTDCVDECGTEDDCVETCGITIYWVIDETKTKIYDADLQLVADDDTLDDFGVNAVVEQNDPNGGSTGASTAIAAWGTDNFADDNVTADDSANQATYRGGVFIIDYTPLAESDNMDDLAAVYNVINDSRWSAVDVHEAQISFAAPIYRKMTGIPPTIALMNDDEDRDSGNAEILESYLRLAGICATSYDVLTPYDIAGIGPDGTRYPSKLFTKKYAFLWAPHWTADDYDENVDLDNNGVVDVQDILLQIQKFVKSGKSMLGECASIEVFEHYSNGLFLTDKGFGHNGVDVKEDTNVFYNNVTQPYAQIGDDPFGFDPEGGHLHNWRPMKSVDLLPNDNDNYYNFDVVDAPDLSEGDSVYNSTVTRFTVDDTDNDGEVTDADWDYYVGGYAYGDSNFGYVVYLGGHKYASCDDDTAVPLPSTIKVKFEFDSNFSDESFTIEVHYSQGGTAQTPVTINFGLADIGTALSAGTDLVIDLSEAEIESNKKIKNVNFTNTGSEISITQMVISWTGGPATSSQEFKKLIDEDDTYWDDKVASGTTIPDSGTFSDFTIAPGSSFSTGCTENSNCSYTNLAGVRYVLNTLFNIKYTIKSKEYVRAPPIVSHPYLYQGSFEYPSNFGHFRRYDVTQEVAAGDLPAADWDTGAHQSYDRIRDANTNNITGRKVYTAQKDNQGVWQLVDFDTQAASLRTLDSLLNITPDDNNDDDETAVINRVRGLEYDYETEVWDEHNYKLGGIMHSAPVIIKDIGGSRFADREEMAYVGDIYGMLHAICTPHGQEKWAYIPSNLLGKLKNVRGDPYATQDFAAVDASATARDLYYDHDADSRTPDAWRTVLVSPQGFGGRSIFALDVTDPRDGNWKVLWETTVPADTSPPTPGGGMGFAYRVALDKVKWPVIEDGDANNNGISNEILGYETKWMVFVATSFAEKVGGFGGLHVFAFDFETGDRVWGFSSQYSTPDNDIPGAVTTMDIDNDTFADRVYVGDINGRMWELAALDGSNPYGTIVDDSDLNDVKTLQVPLFDAGVGYPITVSPAIVMYNNHAILVFGTGGADWAEITNTYNIYGVDATAAKTNWDNMSESEKSSYYQSNGGATTAAWTIPLAAGEKVWSTPTIAAGQIWIVTSTGSMESDIPGQDSVGGSSKLRRLDLNGVVVGTPYSFNKKVRGSLYVSNKHVYMTTFDNEIIQLGDGVFTAGTGNSVVLKSWHHQ